MSITRKMNQNDSLNIASSDNYKVKLNNYVLVGRPNKMVSKFNESIFGSDIGINSKGFITVTSIATLLVIASFAIMYFLFRI